MSRSPQAPRNPTNPTAKRNPPCRVQRGDTRSATETKTLWRWRKTCTQQKKGSNNLSHKRRCESRRPIFFSRKHEAHNNNRPGLAGCRHEVNVQGCNDKGRRIIYIHYVNACKHLNFWAFFFFVVYRLTLTLDPERLHLQRLKTTAGRDAENTSRFHKSSVFSIATCALSLSSRTRLLNFSFILPRWPPFFPPPPPSSLFGTEG